MPLNELGFTPYAERGIQFLGCRELYGCTLKIYSVLYGDGAFDLTRFESGLELASTEIVPGDASVGRPDLGFSILHQGLSGDYVVLSWWDRENELPTRIYVREGGEWRPAQAGESFCIWDIQIIGFERDAYVKTILCPTGASRKDYLDAHLTV